MASGSDSVFLQRYLDAKYRIDSRSLHQATLRRFLARLTGRTRPVLLDIGAGTGATVRRLLDFGFQHSFTYYGLDTDPDMTGSAAENLRALFADRGFVVGPPSASGEGSKQLTAKRAGISVQLELITGDIFDEETVARLSRLRIDTVTANAFFDLVPLRPALSVVRRILGHRGMLYSTINYDGTTTILPPFGNESFESSLLEIYDRSMDDRSRDGRPAGGSRCGAKMFGALEAENFRVVGYGSSDWSIFPWEREYRDYEELFLQSIVRMIYEEARNHSGLNGSELESWYATRIEQIDEASLAFIVHQTDQLAVMAEAPA